MRSIVGRQHGYGVERDCASELLCFRSDSYNCVRTNDRADLSGGASDCFSKEEEPWRDSIEKK